MRFRSIFLGDAAKVNLLIFRQAHDQDRVLLLTVVVNIAHRHNTMIGILSYFQLDIIRSNHASFLVRRTSLLKSIVHAALLTKLYASTLIVHRVLVDVIADKWNQTDSVSDEFVVEYRCVFAHLH